MAANEVISLASVREYLVKNNGKVKNIDLVHHFRQQLNDPANKSKVRGEFKEIVHTIATVQTIDGEKYFVLKKPKEAPAVLRKPPRPAGKARPVSGPPVFRGAKLEEMPVGSAVQSMARSHSASGDESPDLSHPNKENRPLERREGTDSRGQLASSGSVDSGLESNGSSIGSISESTFKMLQSQFLNAGKGTANVKPERLSRSNDDLDRMDDDVEGDDFLMGGPTAHLEPLEKEWLVSAAKGNRAQIMCLLEQDPNLATKKDFMQSAIHWAAKHGRADIVKLLASTGIDVNVRTGGYTPLHLAAMHGRDDVIKMLVSEYEADINSRDFSGKKPKQVARDCLTIEAQGLLEYHFRNYSDTSSESSGYGSLNKYGSTSSNPSIVMASQYNNSEKGSGKNDASDDKSRSRSSSIGKFLMKKKHKPKERAPVPHFPQSSATAGLLISTPLSVESGSFDKSSPVMSQRTYSDPNILKSTGV